MQERGEPTRNDKKMWLLMLSSWPRASSSRPGGSTHKIRGQSGSPRGRLPPQSSDVTHIQRLSVGDTQFRVRSVQHRASVVAQMVKRLPAIRETRVRSWIRNIPLEKEMAIHSSTLAWKIPWTEKPDRLQSMGSQKVRHD